MPKIESEQRAEQPKKRIALWTLAMSPEYREALRDEGFDVVALFNASFPGIVSFSSFDMFHGSGVIPTLAPVDVDPSWIDDIEYRKYARCVQRMNFYPGSEHPETLWGGSVHASEIEDLARLHLEYGLRILESLRIDEVWFNFLPHLGIDNMLALAAIRTGRDCFVLSQSRIAPKFWCTRLGDMLPVECRLSGTQWTNGAIAPNLFYMKRSQHLSTWDAGALGKLPGLVAKIIGRQWEWIGTALYQGAQKRGWWRLMRVLDGLDVRNRPWAAYRYLRRKEFDKERPSRETVTDVGDLGDFVYFPLQLEPEENVHVAGGEYFNQLDAVAAIHAILPSGWILALKENPKQTFQHRGGAFLRRIQSMPRLRFVCRDMSSEELIHASRAVATITGTAGYEALLAGKPCVFFGQACYADLPGAVRFNRQLNLPELVRKGVSRRELDIGMNELLSTMADGLVAPRFQEAFGVGYDVADLYRAAARSMAAMKRS